MRHRVGEIFQIPDFVFQDFTKISVEFIKELIEIKEQQTLQIN